MEQDKKSFGPKPKPDWSAEYISTRQIIDEYEDKKQKWDDDRMRHAREGKGKKKDS